MYKSNHETEPLPKCFGDPKLFDVAAPECMGGHDPAHLNQNPNSPNFKTNVRDTCDWVQACSSRVQAVNQQRPIPASSLVRPTPPHQSHQQFATKFSSPTTPATQTWRPPPSPYTPPHLQQGGSQYMAVNFGIPQYLTVREPQTNGAGFGKRLMRESFRSMLKSIGHTFAHFFDVEIFGSPPEDSNGPR